MSSPIVIFLMTVIVVIVNGDGQTNYPGSLNLETQSGFSPVSPPYPGSAVGLQSSKESQTLENPSYDPNLYTSFVPQDAIQQYVSQFGGPYPPTAYSAYSPDQSGFAVQSGYEGYLVPSLPAPVDYDDSLGSTLSSLGSTLGLNGIGGDFYKYTPVVLKGLVPLPKAILALVLKAGSVVFSAASIVLIGGIITYLICTFTTVCTFSVPFIAGLRSYLPFAQALTREATDTIAGIDVTSDRVKRAAEFVKSAIEKYQDLQRTVRSHKTTKIDVAKDTPVIETDIAVKE